MVTTGEQSYLLSSHSTLIFSSQDFYEGMLLWSNIFIMIMIVIIIIIIIVIFIILITAQMGVCEAALDLTF